MCLISSTAIAQPPCNRADINFYPHTTICIPFHSLFLSTPAASHISVIGNESHCSASGFAIVFESSYAGFIYSRRSRCFVPLLFNPRKSREDEIYRIDCMIDPLTALKSTLQSWKEKSFNDCILKSPLFPQFSSLIQFYFPFGIEGIDRELLRKVLADSLRKNGDVVMRTLFIVPLPWNRSVKKLMNTE